MNYESLPLENIEFRLNTFHQSEKKQKQQQRQKPQLTIIPRLITYSNQREIVRFILPRVKIVFGCSPDKFGNYTMMLEVCEENGKIKSFIERLESLLKEACLKEFGASFSDSATAIYRSVIEPGNHLIRCRIRRNPRTKAPQCKVWESHSKKEELALFEIPRGAYADITISLGDIYRIDHTKGYINKEHDLYGALFFVDEVVLIT